MKFLAASSLAPPLPPKQCDRIKDSGVGCLQQKSDCGVTARACVSKYQVSKGSWGLCAHEVDQALTPLGNLEIRVATFHSILKLETFQIPSSQKHTVAIAKVC